ncbi:iron chelate uptake ABC transporter family permease subunit [Microvirga tunisiensis]|uniref:Iron chelate uptake ABC transporter family permease subunit n=1 Tax=Pannonibacter tanglangensis TaxID=2750084 RepID=A0A7X5F127_9HYPH|nr:iron chelate uptake ABC transporter family permease subunit [Pannonibacter sp. XCT-53]
MSRSGAAVFEASAGAAATAVSGPSVPSGASAASAASGASVSGPRATARARPIEGDRAPRARIVLGCLALALVATALAALMTGATGLANPEAIRLMLAGERPQGDLLLMRDVIVLADIRLPRVIMAGLIGASLAVSGAVMQGLFRNPLADPGIVGVSSGAGLGAAAMIVLGGGLLAPVTALFGGHAVSFAAFLGGLATTALLYRIGTRGGSTHIATMLLAGIALGALAGAALGLLVFVADDRALRDLSFWGLGSVAGATWDKILTAGPVIALVLLLSPLLARALNALVLGEAAAGHLGVNVQRQKRLAIVAVAAATGASVAVSGGIGFVGIVVPHLLRLTIGPDHRYLLPGSALLGAILLIAADTVARTLVAPAELPIGILTALAGAPFFLWILLTRRGFSLG